MNSRWSVAISIPDAGGLVVRRRDDARPVGAEGGGIHDVVMAMQAGFSLAVAASQIAPRHPA
jgi:hypothetical protein